MRRWLGVGEADDLNSLDLPLPGSLTHPARLIRQLVSHPSDADGHARLDSCAHDGGVVRIHVVEPAPLDDDLEMLGEAYHIVRGAAELLLELQLGFERLSHCGY